MKTNEPVPFLDLIEPHKLLEEELLAVVKQALGTAGFIGGPRVDQFEREFAQFCDVAHCVGVGSGTDALRFALIAAGVQPGDAIVTVPNTFIATTEAISQAGASAEFVDVDEQTSNMDAGRLKDYFETACDRDEATGQPISRRTGRPVTAIVPVHLYGQMADMDRLLELAESYNVTIVEDACQSHGAEYFSAREGRWLRAGSIGRAAAFSFYPGKNLGACGEAGAVTTNDETVARTIRTLRDHGQVQKYHHAIEGYNGRLDAIQAGFLLAKLRHLSQWNQQRFDAASRYNDLLASLSPAIALPAVPAWARHVFHLYVIRSNRRDQLRSHLGEAGIDTGIHYPIPLHLQQAYRHLGYKEGDFAVAEALAKQILSLPMYPTLTMAQQVRIVEEIEHFIQSSGDLALIRGTERRVVRSVSA